MIHPTNKAKTYDFTYLPYQSISFSTLHNVLLEVSSGFFESAKEAESLDFVLIHVCQNNELPELIIIK